MENLHHKLNKYTIKLQKFIKNKELIEHDYDKFMLYAKKFKYYYKLIGGQTPEQKAEKQKKAAAAAAEKQKNKMADIAAKQEKESQKAKDRVARQDAKEKAELAIKKERDAAQEIKNRRIAAYKAEKDTAAAAKKQAKDEEYQLKRKKKQEEADRRAKEIEEDRVNKKWFGRTRSKSGRENYEQRIAMEKKIKEEKRKAKLEHAPSKYDNEEALKAKKAGLGFFGRQQVEHAEAQERANKIMQRDSGSRGDSGSGLGSGSGFGESGSSYPGSSGETFGFPSSSAPGSSEGALGNTTQIRQDVISKITELCRLVNSK